MFNRGVQASEPRTDFGTPPPGYVPGVGRGAVGFTTRSDIGPAGPMEEERLAGHRGRHLPVPKLPGTGATSVPLLQQQQKPKTAADDEKTYADSNFDEFSGFSERLFANDAYDQEDRDADKVYEDIDKRMEQRRGKRKTATDTKNEQSNDAKAPRIADLFVDLKNDLAAVKVEDWEAIPDALDYSRHNKLQTRFADKMSAVPDSILLSGASSALANTSVFEQNAADDNTASGDITSVGRARDKMLSMQLDRAADTSSYESNINSNEYLIDLTSVKVASAAELSDIKKARLLLKSVISTNPRHAPGWIAAARLEKELGKMSTARQLIVKACEQCAGSESVWLEAASLHAPHQAKSLLARAVQFLPMSTNIWMRAATLELDPERRKAVLRKALEAIPTSPDLWKAAVELEIKSDARTLLRRAVELVPNDVDLWLSLARLENYDNALVVLNRARKAIPSSVQIWVAACMLEEQYGNSINCGPIIAKSIGSLAKNGVQLDRLHWFSKAEEAERAGCLATCEAIIKHCACLGLQNEQKHSILMSDTSMLCRRGSIHTARFLFKLLQAIFSSKKSVWIQSAMFEKRYGTSEMMLNTLREAVKHVPQVQIVWLMAAKETWMLGDIDGARSILNEAFASNPGNEDIWLAAVKIETENKEIERARFLLTRARESSGTQRIWVKSVKFERIVGNSVMEVSLLSQGLAKFPNNWKMLLMMAQYHLRENRIDDAREIFRKSISICPKVVPLWICFCNFEITASSGQYGRARSILETARVQIPKSDELWLHSVWIEQQSDNWQTAATMLNKALQECPNSGLLWAHAISYDSKPKKKARSFEALKRIPDDPYVLTAVARLFWNDRKLEKARSWFERAVTQNTDLGDSWIYYLRFEQEQAEFTVKQNSANLKTAGATDNVEKFAAIKVESDPQHLVDALLRRIDAAEPTHGALWISISKQDRLVSLKPRDIALQASSLIADAFPPSKHLIE